MYYCNDCQKDFKNLHQYKEEDKMVQQCPICKSENLKLLSNLSVAEKVRFLREHKLDRIIDEKDNIIMSKKEI